MDRLQLDPLLVRAGASEPLPMAATRYDFMRLSLRRGVRHIETQQMFVRREQVELLSNYETPLSKSLPLDTHPGVFMVAYDVKA